MQPTTTKFLYWTPEYPKPLRQFTRTLIFRTFLRERYGASGSNPARSSCAYSEAVRAAAAKTLRGISLQDCLDEFTKEEQLGEDDLWYCPQCKKHQQATKKF